MGYDKFNRTLAASRVEGREGVYSFGMPVFPSLSQLFKGNVYHVDSGHANKSDSNEGTDPNRPMATIDAAVAKCTANNGDVILVSEGHAETITAANAIDLDVAGITVVGLGQGTNRPTITFGTNNAASIRVNAANVRLENFLLLCNKDGVTAMLDVDTTDFALVNCEFREGSAKQWATAVNIDGGAANACDRAKIYGCRFKSLTAGATNAIELGEVADSVELVGNWIEGDWTDAGIHNPGAKVLTNLLIKDNVVSNLNAGNHAIELVSACTGSLIDNRMYGDTLGTILDPGSLKCSGNLETDAIDQAGVASPTTAAGGLGVGAIGAATFQAGAIDAAAIANSAIDAATFAAGAIDAAAIANGAIDAATFAAGAIDAAAIANGAIDAATFAAGAIDAAAIANGAIDAATFAAGAIDAAAIATDAIDADAMADGAITAATFAAGAIDAAAIANGAIDAATFAAGAIDAAAIANGAIDAATFAAGAIDAAAIANGAIDAATFAAGAIDAAAIAAGAIDAATFAAGAIDAAAIAAGAIGAATFAAGAIDAAAIAAGAIDAATFAAGAIDAAAIANSAIDAATFAADVGAWRLARSDWDFAADTGAAGAYNIFTVTGDVLLQIVGVCETSLTSGGAPTIELGVAGNTAVLIAQVVDATGLISPEIWHDATPTTTVEAIDFGAARQFVVTNGQDVIFTIGAPGLTAGKINFYTFWKPLSAAGNVVAA